MDSLLSDLRVAARGLLARPAFTIVAVATLALGLGAAIGLAAALAAVRLLASMLWGVAPHDPVTFAAVPALLGAVGLVAAWAPARRATRVDPAVALREE